MTGPLETVSRAIETGDSALVLITVLLAIMLAFVGVIGTTIAGAQKAHQKSQEQIIKIAEQIITQKMSPIEDRQQIHRAEIADLKRRADDCERREEQLKVKIAALEARIA